MNSEKEEKFVVRDENDYKNLNIENENFVNYDKSKNNKVTTNSPILRNNVIDIKKNDEKSVYDSFEEDSVLKSKSSTFSNF